MEEIKSFVLRINNIRLTVHKKTVYKIPTGKVILNHPIYISFLINEKDCRTITPCKQNSVPVRAGRLQCPCTVQFFIQFPTLIPV